MGRIPIQSSTSTTVSIAGRELLSFAGNNYMALAHHPDVRAALIDAAAALGLTTTSSRETTGNTITHEALEHELAAFLQTESAILTCEGYTANIALAQSLAADHAVAIVDEKSHRSVTQAVQYAGMKVFAYAHLSASHAAELVRQNSCDGTGVLIFTDTVFAADGSLAPLPALLEALPPKTGMLVIDDCHGFCVLGPSGRGTASHFNLSDDRIIITTTLAKGLGCYGGVIAGTRQRIATVQKTAGIYRGTTPVPPPMAHAARAALRILLADPTRAERLRENARLARAGLSSIGIELTADPIPILTFALETEEQMDRVYNAMLERGILAPLIEYPGGPTTRYFRLTVNAEHTPQQIQRLIDELARQLGKRTTNTTTSNTRSRLVTPISARPPS